MKSASSASARAAFRRHRLLCAQIARNLSHKFPPHSLDEQAVPAYVSGNFLSRRLFWKRLSYCHSFIQNFRGGACLDFGCGIGIMLPLLLERFSDVYAVDTFPECTRQFMTMWHETTGRSLMDVQLTAGLDVAEIQESSLDLIVALDVLEHVESLADVLGRLASLMKAGGIMLVSGPTENLLYRIGRKVVGFSGHYHERSIRDVRLGLDDLFSVKMLRRLVYPFTLFEILQATKV